MVDNISSFLTGIDRGSLSGLPEIGQARKERLDTDYIRGILNSFQEETKTQRNTFPVLMYRIQEVLARAELLKKTIDQKCSLVSVNTQEKEGSQLWQAMFRTFGKGSNTVTYQQYIETLRMRREI